MLEGPCSRKGPHFLAAGEAGLVCSTDEWDRHHDCMLVSPHSQIEGVILMILLQALTVHVSEDPSSTCAIDQDGALDWTSKYVLGNDAGHLVAPHIPPIFLQVSL